MPDKKAVSKVVVKKPTPVVTKPKVALSKPVVAKVAKPVVVAKPKAPPAKPVQNKLLNKLLNKPKIKEVTEKKISKYITDKIPTKMVQINKPNNSSLLSMMHQNISSALS